ncbi:hypothetical protein T459_05816 [Capsicum annuum]|uniref:Uncharacterized protein n=1 Tax=Capsicum annuum TaxID=4072 RepID=A0A2G3A953_CAPAN|nr:hypothetical protein T459_05816 [Capsicum annuum]
MNTLIDDFHELTSERDQLFNAFSSLNFDYINLETCKNVIDTENCSLKEQSLQFHDKNESDFDSLFKEIDSKATLDVLQIQRSFELYATGDAHLFLTFPVCIINIDSPCGSPTVISSPSRSLFNKENNVELRSTEESSKGVDHGQARLRTSIFEWKGSDHGQARLRASIVVCEGADHDQAGVQNIIVECVEQYQLGVFITLTVPPSGKKGLRQVNYDLFLLLIVQNINSYDLFLLFIVHNIVIEIELLTQSIRFSDLIGFCKLRDLILMQGQIQNFGTIKVCGAVDGVAPPLTRGLSRKEFTERKQNNGGKKTNFLST